MLHIFDSIIRAVSWSTAFQIVSRPQHHDHTESISIVPHGKIAGGSPLRYCNESRDTDLYQVEYIELYPKPLHMYIPHFRSTPLLSTQLTAALPKRRRLRGPSLR